MNRNTQRRKRFEREEAKLNGGFPKPAYRKKSKPFPSQDGMSLSEQRRIYYGASFIS